MSYYHGWPRYVPAAERRERALRSAEKLRRKGQVLSPVTIPGRAIATTFWGKAWCDNLESYRDYENRLPRGRTYARNGSVLDLQIAPSEVVALVSGSSLYNVRIAIAAIAKRPWTAICKDCAGAIDSLVELLQGRLSASVMERICRQGAGLFPKPAEIRFSCTCPDYASMCKHVAAALYGVGARLDAEPQLLFRLRAVDEKELLASAGAAAPAAGKAPQPDGVLDGEDLSRLFGLDLDPGDDAAPPQPEEATLPKRARSKTPGKTASAKGTTARKRKSRRARKTTSGSKARSRTQKTNP